MASQTSTADPTDAPEATPGLSTDEAAVLRMSPEQQAQVAKASAEYINEALAYDLDEVSPLPVTVGIREYHTVEETDPETNQKRTRGRWTKRTVEIETFVPMKAFNRMWALRDQAMTDRVEWRRRVAETLATYDADTSDEAEDIEEDPMFRWMLTSVWSVWKLTEPAMTMAALREGLDALQVQALFARFFGAALRQSGGRA